MGIAREQEAIARSYYLPQVSFDARYTCLDEHRSVDIPNPISGPIANALTDSAAYFTIARQAGVAAADAALGQPNQPPFSTVKQQAADLFPPYFSTDLVGENFVTAQLLLVQPLWTGGKVRFRHEQAELGTRAAGRDVAKVRQETTFNVTRAYLTVVLTGELQRVATDTAGRFRAIERLARSLLDSGNEYLTPAELHRAGTLRYLAEAEQAGLARARDRAYAALQTAIGLESKVEFEVADRRMVVGEQTLTLSELVERAMARRPELAKAEIGMRVAELERELAKAEFHPEVALFGGMSAIQDDRHYLNPNDSEEWAVGVSGHINVFNGGRRLAQRRQADWRQTQAGQLRQLLRQVVSHETEDAFLEYLEATQRLRLEDEAVRHADESLRLYDDQFAGGLIKDEEMPDYFRDLTLARRLLSESLVRYYQSAYHCNLALGRIRLATASEEYTTFLDSGAR